MVLALVGLPEIGADDDLAALIADAATAAQWPDGSRGLADGDVLVVTSKVVAKAAGLTTTAGRDEVIAAESRGVVAEWVGPDGRPPGW